MNAKFHSINGSHAEVYLKNVLLLFTPLFCALRDYMLQLTGLVQVLRQLRGFPASGLTSYNQALVFLYSF